MMEMELFYELVRVALGNQQCLSHTPSEEEWQELYHEAEKQALLGICLVGAKRLFDQQQGPSEGLYYDWLGDVTCIQQQNELINKQCLYLQKKLKKAGIQSSILKGQGIAKLYHLTQQGKENEANENLAQYRMPGDIDVFVDCGRKGAIDYAKSIGQKDIHWDYKHLHLDIFDDTEVEMHYRVEVLLNLVKNRKLQKWFDARETQIFTQTDDADAMVTPSLEFNAFYILLHIYRHFLYEGVGLRQVLDYYFVLLNRNTQMTQIEKDEADHELRKTLKEFGMMRFASGMMWVLSYVVGASLRQKRWMICEPNEKEGRFILKEIMTGGNFGHFDDRLNHGAGKISYVVNVLKHNWHLLLHYPSDVVWAPIWILYHWCWKRVAN